MSPFIIDHRDALADLCREHHVRSLFVFGSAAREDFDPDRSDVDLLVEFEPLPEGGYADAYLGLREALEALLGREIDFVATSALRNPYVKADVERTRTLLYAGDDAPAADALARPVVDAVAPRLVELDAVRRGPSRAGRSRTVEEACHVVGVRRVAAQDPVVAETVQLARLDVRLVGRLGHIVRVGHPRLRFAADEVAEQGEQPGMVDSHVRQERPELLVVPSRPRPDRAEGREDERLLVGLEVDVEDGDGRLAAGQCERHPGMAVDDKARAPVDEDLLHPADRIERAGKRLLLRLRMDPPVRRVREELVGRLLAGPGDPVAPARGGRSAFTEAMYAALASAIDAGPEESETLAVSLGL